MLLLHLVFLSTAMHWLESLQLPLILTGIVGCVVVGNCVVVVVDCVVVVVDCRVVVIDCVVIVVDCTEFCAAVDCSVLVVLDCVVLLVT